MEEQVFVGRENELNKIKGLGEPQSKGLHFIGAPKIGKTALLNRASYELRERAASGAPFLCPVSIPWSPGVTFALWFDTWLQIRQFFDHLMMAASISGEEYDAVQRAINEHKKAEGENRLRFLKELKALVKELYIVFLLDNFAQALHTSYQVCEGLVVPQELIGFAKDEPEWIKLVVTSRRYEHDALYQVRGVLEEGEWLLLLSREEAYELAGRLLGTEPDNPLLEPIVEWAGYHPYYIYTLVARVSRPATRADIHVAIKKWREDRELQEHLRELWEYLDLRYHLGAVFVLQSVPKAGIPRKAKQLKRSDLEGGIEYLYNRSVLAIETKEDGMEWVRVPARLFRDFARHWIAIPPEQEWYIFTWDWLFKVVTTCLFGSTLAAFLLRHARVFGVELGSPICILGIPLVAALLYIIITFVCCRRRNS